jgi:plastocyanin
MMTGGGNGAGWAILTLLVLLAVAAFVAWTTTRQGPAPDRPQLILDERLARSEITPDEYRDLRTTLGTRRTPRRGAQPWLLAVASIALTGTLLVAGTAGTGGTNWPGWMRDMHEQMWGNSRSPAEPPSPPVPGARTIRVVADEFSFTPSSIRVQPGETVNVRFDNHGGTFHDFHIEDLDFELEADPGERATGSLVAPDQPGRHQIICHVPGHAEAGMRATLIVASTEGN